MRYKILSSHSYNDLEKVVGEFMKMQPGFKPLGPPFFSIPSGAVIIQAMYCE